MPAYRWITLLATCLFLTSLSGSAHAAPSGGVLVAPTATWESPCETVAWYPPYPWHKFTAGSSSCTWKRWIPVPASVRASLTSVRAAVWTDRGGDRWSVAVGERGAGPVPSTVDGQDGGFRYGSSVPLGDLVDYALWSFDGTSLPLDVLAADAPGSTSSLIVQSAHAGIEVTFEDTTPPEIVRIDGLPERIEHTGGSTALNLTLVVRDDGPFPFDQQGTRYRGFGAQIEGQGVTPIFTQGHAQWYEGAELARPVQLSVPPRPGSTKITFTAVDAVGNVGTRIVEIPMVAKVVRPRPLRPRVTGVMRVGSVATCTPTIRIGAGSQTGRSTWQWRRNGRLIPRANRRVLRLTRPLVRARITCTHRITNAAGTGAATSVPRTVLAPRRPARR